MDATMERKLARLYNRPTKYEVIVECAETGDRMLVWYGSRWTRRAVTNMVAKRAEALTAITGVEPAAWEWGTRVSDPVIAKAVDGKAWAIRRSGRTQREAILSGELSFVCDAAATLAALTIATALA